MSTDVRERVLDAYRRTYGTSPERLARAPGRVNLIGDHTDYNDGFVLPMAIDRAVWIACRPRADQHVHVRSLDFAEDGSFELDDGTPASHGRAEGGKWLEYLRGMAWSLRDAGMRLPGWEGVAAGDVPVGAGLSSSAALELATAVVFATLGELPWAPARMARLAQRAENAWVGVNCGIMDQLISAAGIAHHALLIDCRSLDTRPVLLPDSAAVLVLDTATRRGLVESAYNERRAQCEAAAGVFGVRALRDVGTERFAEEEERLDPVTRRRARHVITENARTLAAAEALGRGDLREVGCLMDASHASLRDDFEVSRPELDLMVELARSLSGCYGARMTGAGFGGCAVALVEHDAADDLAADIAARYERESGLHPSVYVCSASAGASTEPIDRA